MSDLLLRRDADDLPTPPDDDAPATRDVYATVVVRSDDAPDECTIFPLFVPEAERVTTWLSAEAGSFVSLAAMR